MKKLALIALAAFAMACSDDDNNSATNVNASIDGTWKLTAFTLDEPVDLNSDNASSTNMMAETSCYGNSTITFVSGTNATINLQTLDITLMSNAIETSLVVDCVDAVPLVSTYTVTQNSVVFNADTEQEQTYVRNGNTLTIHLPGYIGIPYLTGEELNYNFIGATLVYTKQ